MKNQHLHDQDFFAWANEQAALLRAGRLSEADIEHIAEEIESMGKTEKRELVSRLTILLLHLLKWQFQPNLRGISWRISIENARDEIVDHLGDNPSLKSQLDASIIAAYRRARRQATAETGLADPVFPPSCPWSFDLAMDADFWPQA
ncbi:MAG: DUF29 domain-containing protein [Rhodopila sp.]|jgi:hypothetical protein